MKGERRFGRFFGILCVLLFSLLGAALWAQTATGRIVGTVTDQTGAIIPGVTVTVTNVDTMVTYTALSNERGDYQAPLLPIGTYTVSAEQAGFQKAVTKPEKLEINQSLRIDIKIFAFAAERFPAHGPTKQQFPGSACEEVADCR